MPWSGSRGGQPRGLGRSPIVDDGSGVTTPATSQCRRAGPSAKRPCLEPTHTSSRDASHAIDASPGSAASFAPRSSATREGSPSSVTRTRESGRFVRGRHDRVERGVVFVSAEARGEHAVQIDRLERASAVVREMQARAPPRSPRACRRAQRKGAALRSDATLSAMSAPSGVDLPASSSPRSRSIVEPSSRAASTTRAPPLAAIARDAPVAFPRAHGGALAILHRPERARRGGSRSASASRRAQRGPCPRGSRRGSSSSRTRRGSTSSPPRAVAITVTSSVAAMAVLARLDARPLRRVCAFVDHEHDVARGEHARARDRHRGARHGPAGAFQNDKPVGAHGGSSPAAASSRRRSASLSSASSCSLSSSSGSADSSTSSSAFSPVPSAPPSSSVASVSRSDGRVVVARRAARVVVDASLLVVERRDVLVERPDVDRVLAVLVARRFVSSSSSRSAPTSRSCALVSSSGSPASSRRSGRDRRARLRRASASSSRAVVRVERRQAHVVVVLVLDLRGFGGALALFELPCGGAVRHVRTNLAPLPRSARAPREAGLDLLGAQCLPGFPHAFARNGAPPRARPHELE